MENLGIGFTIEEGEVRNRDAIHVAVAPVRASCRLEPGEDVGFVEAGNTELVGRVAEFIGIVDPFLEGPVKAGERFWLFLYPGTTRRLRHDWSHPAFDGEEAEEAAGTQPSSPPSPPPSPSFPTRPAEEESWRTPDVMSLFASWQKDYDIAVLPVLADALEEVGCQQHEGLRRLREKDFLNTPASRLLRLLDPATAPSVRWVEGFAERIGIEAEILMITADEVDDVEEWMAFERFNPHPGGSESDWIVFWGHYEVLTGERPRRSRDAEEDYEDRCYC